MSRRRLIVGGLVAVAAAVVAAKRERLQHLAVPVLADPSAPRAAGRPLDEAPPCRTRVVAGAPGRVTALAVDDEGALWIGTFRDGLWRAPLGGEAAPVGALGGRELFVDALAPHDGRVWAGTLRGAIPFDRAGRRGATALASEAVVALAAVDGRLYGATARGVYALDPGAPERLVAAGTDGEPIRAQALAAAAGQLWIGSPRGVYRVPLDALGAPAAAAWRPLVFGAPGADSDVVTALAPFGDGVLAGTDDAGLAAVDARGVRAARFTQPRADEINPGAALAVDGDAWFGTQGAGVIVARRDGRFARPTAWPAAEVTALARRGDELLAGTGDGRVLAAACP